METIPSTDSEASEPDADSFQDAALVDTIDSPPDVRMDADSNAPFDTIKAEGPSFPVEPTTGTERGPEPPVEPSSPDSRLPDDAGIPDTRIPDTRLPDTSLPDTSPPDTSPPDTNTYCPVVYVKSGGSSVTHSGLGAYCILTCDLLDQPYFGWGCYNFGDRSVRINGQLIECGQTNLPDRVNGHYLFEVSPGSNVSSTITWWGQETISNCPYTTGDPIP